MSYLEYFKEAQERTLRLGLKLPAFAPNNPSGPLLTNEAMHSFIADLQPLSSKWTSQDLVNQCLPVHQIVAPVLRGIIGVEPVVTIGHVRDLRNNDTYFFREEEDFRAHLEEGCQENIRQFHVWLTLPSMEILDITLPASYAEQVGKDLMAASYLDTQVI